jgi:polar amino acid transport system substrate-binding protein
MSAQLIKLANLLLASLLASLPLIASANTLERVQARNSLTLGYVPNFAPFSTQEGDKASGYAIDLCLNIVDKVKQELSLPALQVRYQPLALSEEISAVSAGKVDIVCTPTPATLERRQTVSFSIPVYTAGLSAVVRKNAPGALLRVLNGEVAKTGPTWRTDVNRGLANLTYATLAGGVTEQWIRQQIQSLGVVAKLVTVEDTAVGIKHVADGKTDVFFAERLMLKHDLANDTSAKNLVLLDRIFEYSTTSMVVERDDENFRLLVDATLSEMYRSGKIEQAYDKYLGGASEANRQFFKIYALP